MRLKSLFVPLLALSLSPLALAQSTPAPEGARAYIISPKAGEVVTSPVLVQFGLAGMGVAPAGVAKENTGHHHLLIDVNALPSLDVPIPADDQHRHFGGGQTQVELELPPGEHSLQLMLGDHFHVPHNPPVVSEKVIFTVK
jgi:hypothetical protein